ncbi:hypothetical protein NM688_g9400 [Phlebia brevispora]|uniref:Uncharacterized protein n=1 Tax=Phlebia brevispora TaxID=194682 RepID=A0ACC1RHZ5_9APHY|nr:hypothetical protein NM688_g9400 [Phlebia brevispora]
MATNGDSTLRPRELNNRNGDDRRDSLIRRSWHAMSEVLSPFSPSALASLPKRTFRRRPRYTRADNVPEASQGADGQMPTVRDYHAINSLPAQVRVPKKIATPIKVEGKVWFANERTWVSYLNIAVLIGTLSLALFNASKDQVARNFAYAYAIISVGVLVCAVSACALVAVHCDIPRLRIPQVYGYAVYQRRITMIRKRDPGHFANIHAYPCTDQIAGPLIISALLFCAVLANFIIRGTDASLPEKGKKSLSLRLCPSLPHRDSSDVLRGQGKARLVVSSRRKLVLHKIHRISDPAPHPTLMLVVAARGLLGCEKRMPIKLIKHSLDQGYSEALLPYARPAWDSPSRSVAVTRPHPRINS